MSPSSAANLGRLRGQRVHLCSLSRELDSLSSHRRKLALSSIIFGFAKLLPRSLFQGQMVWKACAKNLGHYLEGLSPAAIDIDEGILVCRLIKTLGDCQLKSPSARAWKYLKTRVYLESVQRSLGDSGFFERLPLSNLRFLVRAIAPLSLAFEKRPRQKALANSLLRFVFSVEEIFTKKIIDWTKTEPLEEDCIILLSPYDSFEESLHLGVEAMKLLQSSRNPRVEEVQRFVWALQQKLIACMRSLDEETPWKYTLSRLCSNTEQTFPSEKSMLELLQGLKDGVERKPSFQRKFSAARFLLHLKAELKDRKGGSKRFTAVLNLVAELEKRFEQT